MQTSDKTLQVVTIDGPAGAGKSTVARRLAERLGFRFLDTGAMYRAVTWTALEAAVEPIDEVRLAPLVAALELDFAEGGRLLANGTDVTEQIRSREVTGRVSEFAAQACVREAMTRLQRDIGVRGRLVCEGRDMGTFVFPDAAVRIYLDASAEVRAERRRLELEAKGEAVDAAALLAEIIARDEADSTREVAPLIRVDEQIYVDSSTMERDAVVDELHRIVTETTQEV